MITPRHTRLVALIGILSVLSWGCSADEDPAAADPDPGTHAERQDTSPGVQAPEEFTGEVDAFYAPPDPLPVGAPGDLIRYEDLGTTAFGASPPVHNYRVMYHSGDAAGEDRAVTGIVSVPVAEPPPQGWPVVSYGHGTAGLASQCAPSRDGLPAPGWGVEGVSAVTDYIGLGPPGEIHPYLSRESEGNSMIDIVTAAGQLPGAGAGNRWVAVGHSQGGHAAMAAHELAAQRAPELELVATAILAPAVGVDTAYGEEDELLMTVLTMAELYGAQSEHADIEVADYLTDEALDAAAVFEAGCVEALVPALRGVVTDGPFEVDPWSTEPAATVLRHNMVGSVAVDGVPVYLTSGTADGTVLIERVRAFFEKLCRTGQRTRYVEVPAADHGSILPEAHEAVGSFLTAALEGAPLPADDCAAR